LIAAYRIRPWLPIRLSTHGIRHPPDRNRQRVSPGLTGSLLLRRTGLADAC
jgi:hypothetical protein